MPGTYVFFPVVLAGVQKRCWPSTSVTEPPEGAPMNVSSPVLMDSSRHYDRVFYAPFASLFSLQGHVPCHIAGRPLHMGKNSVSVGSTGLAPLSFPLPCPSLCFEANVNENIVHHVEGALIACSMQPLVASLGAAGPQALVVHISMPQEAAEAVLVVVAPAVVSSNYAVQTRIPTGVAEWFAPSASLEASPLARQNVLVKAGLERAWNLALASQAVGVAPLGSALVVSAPQTMIEAVGKRLASLLRIWGSGPFVAVAGQPEAALLEKAMGRNPLCVLQGNPFGAASVLATHNAYTALYAAEFAALGKTAANITSQCAHIVCLHNVVRTMAEGTRANATIADIAPRAEQGLHALGTLLGVIQSISSAHGLPTEDALLALLQGRLLQQFPYGAAPMLKQEIVHGCVTYQPLPVAEERGNGLADVALQPLGAGVHALGLGATGRRFEEDSLGTVAVAWNAPYGAQTERSRQNAAVEGISLQHNPRFVQAMGLVKLCAAKANMHIGLMPQEKGNAIVKAAAEVVAGFWDHAFPVDRIQGGGGVGMNMNINEVLAIRAEALLGGGPGTGRVHPNDDVNMCHSTNDLVHSAMHITFLQWLRELDASLAALETALQRLEAEYGSVVKLGRTCLMDALPMTIGQQVAGYLSFVGKRRKVLHTLKEQCRALGMGAGGMGTGIGIAPGFLDAFFAALREETGEAYYGTTDYCDILQHADLYTDISSALKGYAAGLSSMARDLRMMNSGPRCGFGEIVVPAVQPGSSIMPGKINPIIPELVNQVAYLVCGNDTAIAMAAEGSDIDLNVWEAVFLHGITNSAQMLTNATRLFTEKCLEGLVVNTAVCQKHAESSLALATVISEVFGYKQGVQVASYAAATGGTIKEASLALGLLSPAEAEELLAPALLADRDKFVAIVDVFRKKQRKTTE